MNHEGERMTRRIVEGVIEHSLDFLSDIVFSFVIIVMDFTEFLIRWFTGEQTMVEIILGGTCFAVIFLLIVWALSQGLG